MTEPTVETVLGALGRSQKEIARLRATLEVIRDLPDEDNKWHGVDCFRLCRKIAEAALNRR